MLDRSHLSKEKLAMTLEHLIDTRVEQMLKVDSFTKHQIKDMEASVLKLFPQ